MIAAADHLDVVISSASGARTPWRNPSRPTSAKQVVQSSQRQQVLFDGGRAVDEAPAGIVPLDLPHQGAGAAAARCQLDPVGGQAQIGAGRVSGVPHGPPYSAGRRWPGRSCRASFLPTPACGRVPDVLHRRVPCGSLRSRGPAHVLGGQAPSPAMTPGRSPPAPIVSTSSPVVAEVVKVGE